MGRKVLIVEDNPENLELLRELLLFKGYEPLEAGTGVEAVEKALNEKPDVILMDIQLPELDGIMALKKLKENPQTRGIPVIALTAHAMKGEVESFMAEGFDGYIAKPISIKDLLRVLSIYIPEEKGP